MILYCYKNQPFAKCKLYHSFLIIKGYSPRFHLPITRRGDILPDGSALLSLFPVKEDEEEDIFLVGSKPNSRMDLSGIILLKPEEITETVKGSTYASLKSTREHTKILSGSEYSNMEDVNKHHSNNNPMLSTSPVSPKHGSNIQTTSISTIKFQAIFKADLRIDFIPDWM